MEMTKKDWDTFFGLMEKVVELRGKSFNEKTAEVVKQAKERGEKTMMAFEEFTSWDFTLYME